MSKRPDKHCAGTLSGSGYPCRNRALREHTDGLFYCYWHTPGLAHSLSSEDRVKNDQLREAFLASKMTLTDVARNCEWLRWSSSGYLCADVTRVKYLLGLKPVVSRRGIARNRYESFRKTMAYEDAVLIARAIGCDPWEVGI